MQERNFETGRLCCLLRTTESFRLEIYGHLAPSERHNAGNNFKKNPSNWFFLVRESRTYPGNTVRDAGYILDGTPIHFGCSLQKIKKLGFYQPAWTSRRSTEGLEKMRAYHATKFSSFIFTKSIDLFTCLSVCLQQEAQCYAFSRL
ncbi:hypothetical protein AMELA_G00263520 [Ameiurus melas]|uniref:Uncharacterized protein n=1 Tax=Ameiurus melas TaxID=219545 RepID=A0A7J5ZPA0_AMEME|nr:hypothetical protein AMELA_G00263520 [Ameiurus melas]